MLEMELKAILKNKLQVINNLEKQGCQWSQLIFQEDTIYIQKNGKTTVKNPVFRIRKIADKTILTLKIQDSDLNTAKELELEVSDDEIMHQILQVLEFTAKAEVKKHRIETVHKGYTICIDDVERLGDFIEIEKLGLGDCNREKEYDEMRKVLQNLGINEDDFVTEKYFEMLLALNE